MIEARGVRVEFRHGAFRRRIRALDGFDLSVEPGTIFGLVGPNGAGKSTAMYTLLGLIRPDAGEVRILGEEPLPGSPLFERIAYVPEEPHYHLYLTVEEALRFYGRLVDGPKAEARVEGVLERLDLREARDLRLSKCSKGMKQKVGLGTVLLSDPEIVFLDEPTRGLDPITVRTLRDVIQEMNGRGTTFFINSHVLSEVESICDRVAVVQGGKVILESTMEQLLAGDVDAYTVEIDPLDPPPDFLLGCRSEKNRLRGEVRRESLPRLFRLLEENPIRLYECSLRRKTLEEAFLESLRKGNP